MSKASRTIDPVYQEIGNIYFKMYGIWVVPARDITIKVYRIGSGVPSFEDIGWLGQWCVERFEKTCTGLRLLLIIDSMSEYNSAFSLSKILATTKRTGPPFFMKAACVWKVQTVPVQKSGSIGELDVFHQRLILNESALSENRSPEKWIEQGLALPHQDSILKSLLKPVPVVELS